MEPALRLIPNSVAAIAPAFSNSRLVIACHISSLLLGQKPNIMGYALAPDEPPLPRQVKRAFTTRQIPELKRTVAPLTRI
jgi:hypothetical protein